MPRFMRGAVFTRHAVAAVVVAGLIGFGSSAQAQQAAPVPAPAPPVVQAPVQTDVSSSSSSSSSWATDPWIIGGAVVGVVALNAATSGAMLAPLAGPAVSGWLGGGWLGPAALSVGARQALCRGTTLVAGAAAGATLGYWLSVQ